MNIDRIGGEGYKDFNPLEDQGEFNKTIPFDVFEIILFNLDGMDLQQANLVDRLWSLKSINIAKQKELFVIKGFTQFLCESLPKDSYPNQRKALLDMCSDTKVLGGVNLIEIKYSIEEMKENLLIIIKDLSDKDLSDLEDLSQKQRPPLFFENIFVLAQLYKQVDETNAMPKSFHKWKTLQSISKALAVHGQIDKAVEVANGIEARLFGEDAFLDIFEILIQNGKIGRAEQVANRIADKSSRGIFLREISKELTKRGDVDKAIEIADRLYDELRRAIALRDICKALVMNGNLDKALLVASMISDEFREQGLAFRDICGAFAQMGEGVKALECAIRITDEPIRLSVLNNICGINTSEIQIKSPHLDKFIEIAKIMPPDDEQGYVLQDLSEELVGMGDIVNSLTVANMISNKIQRDESLHYIFKTVKENSEKGFVEKSIESVKNFFGY